MSNYKKYAESIVFSKSARRSIKVEDFHKDLEQIGTGRSACVFRIKNTNIVIKVFAPRFKHIALEEAEIYKKLAHIHYFPEIYETGRNYIVMDYIEGETLFDCLNKGIAIEEQQVHTIDEVLQLARQTGLNPSDIHLRNIIITSDNKVKLIDVARFKQTKKCEMWNDLKRAYFQYYLKPYFPRRIPKIILNIIAVLYKKEIIHIRGDKNRLLE
ncbi:protein kinase domain-containing protein [Bacillus massiliigorillae]|uniref:protein kinase domain-containing protein n=1 Tax=Bacillus massiliigorillae TaxID=1243664 RepID=UPI00039F3068|nr:RIO1 family regulatory kinase/ATPase [Bacillus massiliigorillae]